MAQAAKQLKKIKDIEAQALQEQKEKEESNRKRRNRSRDRKKKVSGTGASSPISRCLCLWQWVLFAFGRRGEKRGAACSLYNFMCTQHKEQSLPNGGQLLGSGGCCLPQ